MLPIFKMFRALPFLFICLGPVLAGNEVVRGCSMKMNGDLPAAPKQPIFLKLRDEARSMILPEVEDDRGFIILKEGEKVKVTCPGKGNFLVFNKRKTTELTCVIDTTFEDSSGKSSELYNQATKLLDGSSATSSNKVASILKNFEALPKNSAKDTSSMTVSTKATTPVTVNTKDVSCAHTVEAEIRKTNSRCSGVGKIYDVGFDQDNEWGSMLYVCHNAKQGNTLYTKHQLYGASVEGAEQVTARPKFQLGKLKELYPEFIPDDVYGVYSQQVLFKKLFGNNNAKKYFNTARDLYFERGVLAPAADFIYGREKFSTYFYINVAPQWQIINSGNWMLVENIVRQYAIRVKKQLTILTGTYGILALENDDGELKEIYLNDKNETKTIPVPKYHWKVVYDDKKRSGIAFLTSNNPFLTDGTKLDFCNNPCQDYGFSWLNSTVEFLKGSKGITSCCPVSELRKVIKPTHVPFLDIDQTLQTLTFNTNLYVKPVE